MRSDYSEMGAIHGFGVQEARRRIQHRQERPRREPETPIAAGVGGMADQRGKRERKAG